jgi:protein TonB
MSAENKYDKFERDLLSATAAKKPKDETEVEKTVDDLLKSTLAGIGIDPEKKKQILQEAEAQAKPEPPKPPPPPKAGVIGLRPADRPDKQDRLEKPDRFEKPEKQEKFDIQEKSAKAESPPWIKEPPRPPTFVPPTKIELPVYKEKAEMPFPSLKKDEVFLEEYGKEKKKSKPIVPIIISGLVVVIAVAAFLIFFGGKKEPPVSAKSTASGVPSTQTVPGPAEAVTGSPDLASMPGPETKSAVELTGQKIPETKAVAEKPAAPAEKKQPAETGGSPTDSAVAPFMPTETSKAKVQEIKPTRTAPSDKTPPRTTESSEPAKPKVILGQLVPINEADQAPVLVRRVDPSYPPLAQRMSLQGSVKINALIDETGSVIRTEVLQASSAGPSSGFEKASQDAVMKWKYKPAVKEGTYVKVWMPVLVTFNIKR